MQLTLCVLLSCIICKSLVNGDIDETFRKVYLKDLLGDSKWKSNHRRLSIADADRISRVAIHEESDSLLLALNNTVLRYSLESLQEIDRAVWLLPSDQTGNCSKLGGEVSCPPYTVSLLLPTSDAFPSLQPGLYGTGIYTCLTNSLSAECSLTRISDMKRPPELRWRGVNHCPTTTNKRISAIVASTGDIYIGAHFGSTPPGAAIVANTADGHIRRFVQTEFSRLWLAQDGSTEFVHSFEFHDAIYFVFRESADEVFETCREKVIVSRVGRVCLNDKGGQTRRLQSFSKATLVCPGTVSSEASAFVYAQVQSVSVDPATQSMFAAFSTHSSTLQGSAVCEFHLTDVEDVLSGQVYTPSSSGGTTRKASKCSEHAHSNFWSKPEPEIYLALKSIRPRQDKPILARDGTIWSHLLVDWVPGMAKSERNLILFTIDAQGTLQKWHHHDAETCLVEQIELTEPSPEKHETSVIHANLFHKHSAQQSASGVHLLIATTHDLIQLPAARCERFRDGRDICAAMHDPYCAWSAQHKKCLDRSDVRLSSKERAIFNSCPSPSDVNTELSIDGQWGSWSSWAKCPALNKAALPSSSTQNAYVSVAQCNCRYRSCTNPIPFGSMAKECMSGTPIELGNCSITPGWTTWSPWSSCEPSCLQANEKPQLAKQTRTRSCTNPAPSGHPAKNCAGKSVETRFCHIVDKKCTGEESEAIVGWSLWSEWTACSTVCNGGQQLRWRRCDKLHPGLPLSAPSADALIADPNRNQGPNVTCIGPAHESRSCNKQTCPVVKVTSPWTNWYVVDGSWAKGQLQRRYRVECLGEVLVPDNLKAEVEQQDGLCVVDGTNRISCREQESQIDSPESTEASPEPRWSAWTSCSHMCGGGLRKRWNLNSMAKGKIDWENESVEVEEETCNTQPCEGRWSCWSSWSECDRKGCEVPQGVQHRTRRCLLSQDSSASTPDQCDGGPELSAQSRPCEIESTFVNCYELTVGRKVDIGSSYTRTKRSEDVGSVESASSWASWSDCFKSDHAPYTVRVRSRAPCEGCQATEVRRCDTNEPVLLNEANLTSEAHYGLGIAILVSLLSAIAGVAVVLVPYILCTARKRNMHKQLTRVRQSNIWNKMNCGTSKSQQFRPYIWLRQNGDENQRKHLLHKQPQPAPGHGQTKPLPNFLEPSSSQSSGKHSTTLVKPGTTLTGIQALHNDHRPHLLTNGTPRHLRTNNTLL